MKRILVAGNSHIGALKSGLGNYLKKQSSVCEEYEWTFAGTTGALDLMVDKGSLTVSPSSIRRQEFLITTGGQDLLDLESFEYIFLVGKFTPLDVRHFFSVNLQPMSVAVVSSIVKQIIGITFLSDSVYSKLVQRSPGKCFWIPNPCEPEKVNSLLLTRFVSVPDVYQRIRGTNHKSCYLPFLDSISIKEQEIELLLSTAKTIKDVSFSLASEKGLKGIIFPPDSVLKNGFLTLSCYSKDSRHFSSDIVHPEVDPHMNSDYGEIIISTVVSSLSNYH